MTVDKDCYFVITDDAMVARYASFRRPSLSSSPLSPPRCCALGEILFERVACATAISLMAGSTERDICIRCNLRNEHEDPSTCLQYTSLHMREQLASVRLLWWWPIRFLFTSFCIVACLRRREIIIIYSSPNNELILSFSGDESVL